MRQRTAIILLLLAAGTGWAVLRWKMGSPQGGPPSVAAVPISTARASRQGFDSYLEGLGTVQALERVSVRPQVDGQILRVAFHEGDAVRKGDLLALIDPRPYRAVLDQATARRDQDQAQFVFAQKTLERDTALLNRKLLDQQAYDLQAATVAQQRALLEADAAAVRTAQLQLDFTKIVSPLDGRMGFRLVDQGNTIRATEGTAIATIARIQPIAVVFTLPEKDVGAIRRAQGLGAPATGLTVLAWDRENNRMLAQGTLLAIDNRIDEASGTIGLKAVFPNQPETLWPGQFVSVKLLVERADAGLVVPESALQSGPSGSFVYVVNSSARAQVRAVEVARVADGRALIARGLSPGEEVVTDGQYLLEQGSSVKRSQPAASPSP